MDNILENNPIEVLIFKISSPCGRVYELPLKKVQEDYIAYLVKEDKITPEEAAKNMNKDDIESWFMEQFNWDLEFFLHPFDLVPYKTAGMKSGSTGAYQAAFAT